MATMYEQFKSRAENVGAEIHRFKTKVEAFDFIITLLKKEEVIDASLSYAIWSDGPIMSEIDKTSLSNKVPGLRFDITRQTAADSLVGISEMGWALADTGTLVADQTAINDRLASTLPSIHIALVGTDRLLPDKAAVFTRINPKSSRYIAFITGPSRTSDIERVLTIGVHGPKRLIIVFVDEMERGSL
jgi:L-lactate dehydrogenase complex protein LldG